MKKLEPSTKDTNGIPTWYNIHSTGTVFEGHYTLGLDSSEIYTIENIQFIPGSAHKSTEVKSNPITVPVKELINFKYQLKKPLEIILEYENGEWLGYIEALNLYEWGKDEFEVLRQLNEDLTDLFNSVVESKEYSLGLVPSKWKTILEDHIELNES